MKIISIAVLLSFISVCVYAQPYNKSIDSLIRTYVSLNKFNGNVLITKAGKIVFRGAYGFRDVEANSKCAGKEIFQLASLTKSFTAVVILKLIEEKKLSPDTPISTYFPGIHPDSDITVANLLNHTSGIREVLRDSVLRGKIFAGMKTSQEELISYFSSQPLDFAPGTVFSYSNSGYGLLGMIIEKITRISYGEAVKRLIFDPLKMKNSGYDFASLKSRNKTIGYDYLSPSRFVTVKTWDYSWTYASGGLYSCVDDLHKFYAGLKNNKIISAQSLAQSYTSIKGDYGFGWFIDSLYGKRIVYHSGNLDGATSYFGRIPGDDICIIMLNNQTSTTIESIASKIIAILNDKPYTLPKPKLEITVPKEILQQYVGKYDISDTYDTSVQISGSKLYLTGSNNYPIRIFAETNNRFFALDSNMMLNFGTDEKGKIKLTIKDGLSTKIGNKL